MSIRAIWSIVLLACCAGPWAEPAAAQAPAAPRDTIALTLDLTNPANLAILLAEDRGYFAAQNIRLDIRRLTASSTTLLPLLARGDLQISPIAVSAAFFNQFTSGFDLKLIASSITAQAGWQDMTWIMVRNDVWESGAVRRPADLRGRTVELGPDGSPIMALMMGVLREGGLTNRDVNAVQRVRTPADMFTLLRNQVVEAIGLPEPAASAMQREGVGRKWMSVSQINPGAQELFLGASARFLTEQRDLARRFMVAYLRGQQDVTREGPAWTAATLQTFVARSGYTEAQARDFQGPPYPGALGRINVAAVEAQQQLWRSMGRIQQAIDVRQVIDESVLDEARRIVGIDN
jgi:NitT/TauT family transport system substrate-binding protein